MRWEYLLLYIACFLGNLSVKELCKSAHICRSYDETSSVLTQSVLTTVARYLWKLSIASVKRSAFIWIFASSSSSSALDVWLVVSFSTATACIQIRQNNSTDLSVEYQLLSEADRHILSSAALLFVIPRTRTQLSDKVIRCRWPAGLKQAACFLAFLQTIWYIFKQQLKAHLYGLDWAAALCSWCFGF